MKILLVHQGATGEHELAASLLDTGHVLRVLAGAGEVRTVWPEGRPDVVVALLEADSAKTLDLVASFLAQRAFAGVPLLVTGGNELAITAARRRFPEASFARLDSVETALASIEAGE